jgi:hypothetical protein
VTRKGPSAFGLGMTVFLGVAAIARATTVFGD